MQYIAAITQYWRTVLGWSWRQILDAKKELEQTDARCYLLGCSTYWLKADLDAGRVGEGKEPEVGEVGGITLAEIDESCKEAQRLGVSMEYTEEAVEVRKKSSGLEFQRANAAMLADLFGMRHTFGGHDRRVVATLPGSAKAK